MRVCVPRATRESTAAVRKSRREDEKRQEERYDEDGAPSLVGVTVGGGRKAVAPMRREREELRLIKNGRRGRSE